MLSPSRIYREPGGEGDGKERMDADEDRGFKEEVRYWTLWMLSWLEGD